MNKCHTVDNSQLFECLISPNRQEIFAGERINFHVGGGVDFDYMMVDEHRGGQTDGVKEERVIEVRRDPNRQVDRLNE